MDLRKIADSRSKISRSFRKKRWEFFLKFLKDRFQNNKILILDVGGTCEFWRQVGFLKEKEVEITILNLADDALIDGELKAHVKYVNGDGCNMKRFADQQFDVVFSNSVIEHVGAFDRQRLMADEIKRVGKNYYIQTPNYWFPFEPHFLVFGFQFLPLKIKTFFIRRFNIGWFKKIPDYCEAQVLAKSIRLLKKKELKKLFPGANITSEMFLCLAKSFIVYNNIKK